MAEQRRNILRLFGTDISGDKKIKNALRGLEGISFNAARAILKKADVDASKTGADLTDEELGRIEEVIEEGEVPAHILNRRKGTDEGGDGMMVSSDLEIQERQDIEDMKKLASYRGLRHRRGLPVRGQQTRSSFRGQSSVGVSTERIKQEEGGED